MKAASFLASLLALLLAGPAGAEPGNGRGHGGCPPGLAARDPSCTPPGQARREGRDPLLGVIEALARESREEDPDPVEPLLGLVDELAQDGDEDAEAAVAIVGVLLGLAALERAGREAPEREEARAEPEAPEPFDLSDVPARPAWMSALAEEPEAFPIAPPEEPEPAAAPLGPPVPIGEPSLLIPPPPPMAEDIGETPPSDDLSAVLDRAAEDGDTGF